MERELPNHRRIKNEELTGKSSKRESHQVRAQHEKYSSGGMHWFMVEEILDGDDNFGEGASSGDRTNGDHNQNMFFCVERARVLD